MGRAPCCDKANVKKGPWSPEEDAKLKDFIEKFGTAGNWISLPLKAGLKRCGKSCRLRWLNYLRPNIKHGEFSEQEDTIICNLYATIGSRWSIIAAQLPGRTDNDIKNYWNTKLKKKLLGNLMMSSSNQAKLLHPFSTLPQSQTLSSLSQLYTSFYNQATKSLSMDPIPAPQNLLFNANYSDSPPLYPYYQQSNQDDEGFMDFQFCPMKDNMLMFGAGNEASCSSSDGSFQGFMAGENNRFVIEDPLMDHKGHVENSQLQYDIEEVKQLIKTTGSNHGCNNNLLFSTDEIKIEEGQVYYYS